MYIFLLIVYLISSWEPWKTIDTLVLKYFSMWKICDRDTWPTWKCIQETDSLTSWLSFGSAEQAPCGDRLWPWQFKTPPQQYQLASWAQFCLSRCSLSSNIPQGNWKCWQCKLHHTLSLIWLMFWNNETTFALSHNFPSLRRRNSTSKQTSMLLLRRCNVSQVHHVSLARQHLVMNTQVQMRLMITPSLHFYSFNQFYGSPFNNFWHITKNQKSHSIRGTDRRSSGNHECVFHISIQSKEHF